MATAFLYDDGSLVFSSTDIADSSKTLVASYTGWDTETYTETNRPPWSENDNNIINVSFDGVITPNCTSYWFYDCNNLKNFDSTNLDVSKVKNMSHMFKYCNSLTHLQLDNFDTSNVTDMSDMFSGGFISIDLSSFDTSNVTNMAGMFASCSNLTDLNIRNFNTSNVTDMSYMFEYCSSLTHLQLNNFDTSKVRDLSSMFNRCFALTSLDLSSFDTSNVEVDMDYMFYDCWALKTIYVSDKWVVPDGIEGTGMFSYCNKLIGGNGTVYNGLNTDITYARIDTPETAGYFTYKRYIVQEDMLIKNTTLYNLADKIRVLSGTDETMTPVEMETTLDTHNTEMVEVLATQDNLIAQIATALKGKTSYVEDSMITRNIAEYSNDRVTSIGDYAFYSYQNLTTVDFPNVTSIGDYAFYNCNDLTTVDFSNATSISNSAFNSCGSLITVNFPNATSIGNSAFNNCDGLTTIDFPNATSIGNSAFNNCDGLTTVNFPNATSIGNSAFNSCNDLTTVDFPNATSIGDSAFYNCDGLTTVDFPNVTSIGDSAFNGCGSLTTVDFPNVTSIGDSAFVSCAKLTTVIIRTNDIVCTISSNLPLYETAIDKGAGFIYVPKSFIEEYKASSNWSKFANNFRALEDYTVDGTITGKLDENKISSNPTINIVNYDTGEEAQLTFEAGMTWNSFIGSNYNINNRFTSDGSNVYWDDCTVYYNSSDNEVNPTDVIDMNDTYWC